MNFLVLINGAPAHRPFFAWVGDALRRDGHGVFYAVDSHYTEYLYPDAPLPASRTAVFSDYVRDLGPAVQLPSDFEDVNLWTAMFPELDRSEFSVTMLRKEPQYYERILVGLVRFFDQLIAQQKIDCVVYETVSNTFAYVACLVAQKRSKRYVGFGMSRIPGRVDVTDGPHFRHSRTEQLYLGIRSGDVKVDADTKRAASTYRANIDRLRPDYATVNATLTRSPFERFIRKRPALNYLRAIRYLVSNWNEQTWAFQVSNPLVVYPEVFVRETARWLRSKHLARRYYGPPVAGERYFVYPMQYHPESSSAVDGTYFADDLSNIINIAANMPMGTRLYVRDHPYAFAQPKLRFYRRVKRLPNVRLIDFRVDGKDLVRSCEAVVTNTSTMGFEAIVLRKPVFVLGHPFYDFHPLVRRITSWDTAFDTLRSYRSVDAPDDTIDAFLQAYFLSSYAASYDLKALRAEDANAFAKLIVTEATAGMSSPLSPVRACEGGVA